MEKLSIVYNQLFQKPMKNRKESSKEIISKKKFTI